MTGNVSFDFSAVEFTPKDYGSYTSIEILGKMVLNEAPAGGDITVTLSLDGDQDDIHKVNFKFVSSDEENLVVASGTSTLEYDIVLHKTTGTFNTPGEYPTLKATVSTGVGNTNFTDTAEYDQAPALTRTVVADPDVNGIVQYVGAAAEAFIGYDSTGKDYVVVVVKSGNVNGLEEIYDRGDDPSLIVVSKITDFSSVFSGKTVSGYIGNWDVMNGIYFNSMFEGAVLTEDHGFEHWDFSAATTFASMFKDVTSFSDNNLSGWSTTMHLVTNFSSMFEGSNFNGDVTTWFPTAPPASTTMARMFANNNEFNQDISGWNVSTVVNFSGMFDTTIFFNQDISGWNTMAATDMSSMFRNAASFNQNISDWTVTNVLNAIYPAVKPLDFDVGSAAGFEGNVEKQPWPSFELKITSDVYMLFRGQTATITFDFSGTPDSFEVEDITLSDSSLGDLGDFTYTGMGNIYTAVFTPAENTTGVLNISVTGLTSGTLQITSPVVIDRHIIIFSNINEPQDLVITPGTTDNTIRNVLIAVAITVVIIAILVFFII